MPAERTCPFIVIEALDAGGSQTQTDYLVRHLRRAGWQPRQYHFPQEATATGRLIYDKFLLHLNRRRFSRREQALLYIQDFFSKADEMWAIAQQKPAQTVIVSDRYCTSTLAYQTVGLAGPARRAMIGWISWLCWHGHPALLRPSRVIFIDTPVDIVLGRLANKRKDYFETRQRLVALRRSYRRLAREQRWTIVNGVDRRGQQRSRADIHREVWRQVQPVLP